MLGNKPPYTTMQQLNLDWVLSKLKTLLRLVPDDGAVGQILRRTRDGAVWSDEQGGGGGGAVQSVNGKTGAVVLDAADVGALPDDYTPPVTSVNGQTGAVVLDAADVGALPDDYTPPVTSVNGQTGAVTVSVPVQSVNGKTGAVVLDADDVGALPDDYTPPVTSVNGQTGAVVTDTVETGTLLNESYGKITYAYNPAVKICAIAWGGTGTTAPQAIISVNLPEKIRPVNRTVNTILSGYYIEVSGSLLSINTGSAAWTAGYLMYYTV